ncbi:hypothetical protein GA0115246_110651, partial [Streptomyces sp. SolWspMP-sol7th]
MRSSEAGSSTMSRPAHRSGHTRRTAGTASSASPATSASFARGCPTPSTSESAPRTA